MSLLLQIIMTYIKENIITKLQKLYSLPRNPSAGHKLLMLFVKKPLCTGDLSAVHKIFIERPEVVPILLTKSLKNICKEICIWESFSVLMNKIFEMHQQKNSVFQFIIVRGIFFIILNAPLLKCLTSIFFSKPPSRNSIFIQLVYNEDKIISFLYLFILIYIYLI